MNDSVIHLALDLQETNAFSVVSLKKGDTARKIVITLSDGGFPYTIADECRAVFSAKKADGNAIYNECTIADNTITYDVTSQTTSCVGKVLCEVILYGFDDRMITSASFLAVVQDTVYHDGDSIASVPEANALDTLVSQANELIRTVNEKLENGDFIGPPGDPGPVEFSELTVEQIEMLKGPPGDPGTTPVITIGANGNWHIDAADTGVQAQGQAGTIPDGGVTTSQIADGAVTDSKISDTVVRVNPNLLDNWYFANPIDRRTGWGSIEGYYSDYFIDRWVLAKSGTAKVEYWYNNGVKAGLAFFASSGNPALIDQKVRDPQSLAGKMITFSVFKQNVPVVIEIWYKRASDSADTRAATANLAGDTVAQITATIPDTQIDSIFVRFYTESVLALFAAKLEIGSNQTLCHKEGNAWVLNEIPDYSEQLARCLSAPAEIGGGGIEYGFRNNPNLLDNWYFGNPVNQRGVTNAVTSAYFIDRWRTNFSSGSVTLTSAGIQFTKDANGLDLIQKVEPSLKAALVGKQLTMSALFSDNTMISDTRTFGGSSGTEWFTASGNLIRLVWYGGSGAFGVLLNKSCTIVAIKLEIGSNQTLCHRENNAWVLNEVPDYGEQLARCQRYYQKFNGLIVTGYRSTGDLAYVTVPTSVPFRAKPAASNLQFLAFRGNGAHGTEASLDSSQSYVYLNDSGGMIVRLSSATFNAVPIPSNQIISGDIYGEFSADL